jgi:formylglycine-generating enzyme required for sulfatase activity
VADGRTIARPEGVNIGDREAGARIGRYVVLESVGTGAMGVVYGAYDPELDRKIALKLIKPGQGAKTMARERLLREAKAMARLQHPNVVAVHDVGVYEDQVFLAMEFLAAGTIKDWLKEKPRSWREILTVFIAAGRGLAAAHEAGIVHRDFKPENVLLDKDGRPRVVDFGIARQAESARDEERGAGTLTPDEAAKAAQALEVTARLKDSSGNVAPLLTLTKTGTWVGTPAYMAPEQFLGERGDEKSDQFSFCVALYEALYGERPFAGDDMLSLSVSVTTEHFRPLPKDRGVPAWIRRVITRGIRSASASRWPSMAALIAALEDDPAVKLRRSLIVGGAVAAVVVVMLVAWQMVSRRRLEAEREISRHLQRGETTALAARDKVGTARDLRQRAFTAFDAPDLEGGETLWRQARALIPAIDDGYDQAERAFETAFTLDPSRADLRARLADVRYDHLLFAEDFRLDAKRDVLHERLLAVDVGGSRRKRLAAPGAVSVQVTPAGARIVIERYDRDSGSGRRKPTVVATLEAGVARTLTPGTYRVMVDKPGFAPVAYPFDVRRGEQLALALDLPPASAVPAGFVYVPAGEFWFGDADELLRTQFLGTVPIHKRRTDAFLMARRETTYREWIAFLEALPSGERPRNQPDVSMTRRGSLRLRETDGSWQFVFQPSTVRYTAMAGEPVSYLGRTRRARQDWLSFPVAGISRTEAERYFKWLRATGKVPGARLCAETEWERAARGCDDRVFPHGDELAADDADIDVTYGRVDGAYGPDEVGSHPASVSPFGIDDLVGNLFELVTSSLKPGDLAIRGGSYFYQAINGRITNHETVPSTYRDTTTGLRVCASFNEGS